RHRRNHPPSHPWPIQNPKPKIQNSPPVLISLIRTAVSTEDAIASPNSLGISANASSFSLLFRGRKAGNATSSVSSEPKSEQELSSNRELTSTFPGDYPS